MAISLGPFKNAFYYFSQRPDLARKANTHFLIKNEGKQGFPGRVLLVKVSLRLGKRLRDGKNNLCVFSLTPPQHTCFLINWLGPRQH